MAVQMMAVQMMAGQMMAVKMMAVQMMAVQMMAVQMMAVKMMAVQMMAVQMMVVMMAVMTATKTVPLDYQLSCFLLLQPFTSWHKNDGASWNLGHLAAKLGRACPNTKAKSDPDSDRMIRSSHPTPALQIGTVAFNWSVNHRDSNDRSC